MVLSQLRHWRTAGVARANEYDFFLIFLRHLVPATLKLIFYPLFLEKKTVFTYVEYLWKYKPCANGLTHLSSRRPSFLVR